MKIVVIGKNGSGKGTLAQELKRIYKIPHISTGDMFRGMMMKETELGRKIRKYMKSNELVPDDVAMDVVKERISEKDCENGYILDGFPRTKKQAEELDKITAIDSAILLEVSDEEIITRLSNRYVCKKCNIIYGVNKLPEKKNYCDKCKGELYRREDDEPSAVKKRLEIFAQQFKPIMRFYDEQNKLYKIDGNKKPSEVIEDVVNTLNKLSES